MVGVVHGRAGGLRHRWLLNNAAVLSVLALLAAAATTPAAATPPGQNGRIAFMRADNGVWQVWVSDPDLTDATKLTFEERDSGWPTWAPDGTRIAFDSARTDSDPEDAVETNDVFTMDPDGTDVVKVTDSVGLSGSPSWSPDGDWLAITADRGDYPTGVGIYLIRPDGTGLRRVTSLPASSSWQDAPRFSPDGSKLVFTEYRGGKFIGTGKIGFPAGARSALYVVNVDGTNLHRVTGWGTRTGDADWSPDGRRLVFETEFGHIGNTSSVMTVAADGGHLTALTKDAGFTGIGNGVGYRVEASFDPVWSPDGTRVLFSHETYADGQYTCGLQVINSDGTGQAYASPTARDCEHQVDWGTAPVLP